MMYKDTITTTVERIDPLNWNINVESTNNKSVKKITVPLNIKNFGDLATEQFAQDLSIFLEAMHYHETSKAKLSENPITNRLALRRYLLILSRETKDKESNLYIELQRLRNIYFCRKYTPSGRTRTKVKI